LGNYSKKLQERIINSQEKVMRFNLNDGLVEFTVRVTPEHHQVLTKVLESLPKIQSKIEYGENHT